jgi:hypothetical protein
MYNKILEDKLFLLSKAEDFAQYYSKRIKDDLKRDSRRSTLILIRDFTPIFILGFASYFDNVRIILTQNYNFEKDIMFNMKNTCRASVLTTYIKALYYKAPKLKTLIRQGYKLQESDLNFNTKDFNQKRISVKNYTVGFDLDQYVTKLQGFPALVIDARIFENTVKEIKKNESDLVLFYTNLIIKEPSSENNQLDQVELEELVNNIKKKNEDYKKDPNPLGPVIIDKIKFNKGVVNKKNSDCRFNKFKNKPGKGSNLKGGMSNERSVDNRNNRRENDKIKVTKSLIVEQDNDVDDRLYTNN